MKRAALIGLLAVAACDFPLVMVEVEAPTVCATRQLDVDPTSLTYTVSNTDPDGDLPSQVGINLSAALNTDIQIDDNVLELPPEAQDMKDFLDFEVQIQRVRIEALAPDEHALDNVNAATLIIVPPVDSGLAEKALIQYDRVAAATPPGGAVEVTGDMINIADYAFSGQLRFKYQLDATIETAAPWTILLTACVATHGTVEVSYQDVMDLDLSGSGTP